MKYTAVAFTSSTMEDWQKDLLIAELGDLGYDTFEDLNQGFTAYIPAVNVDLQALETLLATEVQGYDLDYKVLELEDQNWNQLWESNFSPILVQDQCYVRAAFHQDHPEYPYQIIINPKMSFGTGHHQTTSMMLSFILENDFTGKSMLDMGCGTGILGILASKMGAKNIVAVDFDPICVESVAENILLNNTPNISGKLGSKEVIEGINVDTILANINRNILVDQMPAYAKNLPINGELYLSGFYEENDLEIIKAEAAKSGFQFIDKKVLDTWCAAKFIKAE